MTYRLTRPAADFDAGDGLPLLEHFQMAYVTNGLNRARTLFRERLGIREFAGLEGATPAGMNFFEKAPRASTSISNQ